MMSSRVAVCGAVVPVGRARLWQGRGTSGPAEHQPNAAGWLPGTAGRSGEGITQGVGVRHVPAPPRHRIKQLDQHSHLIMLALKKKREAEAKAKAEAEAAAAASPGGKDGASAQAPEKVSILGIGGKKKKDSGKDGAGGKKRTPGEIRIQKGEAAFDATKCTLHARIFMYKCVACLQRLSFFMLLAGTPRRTPHRPMA